VTKTRRGEQLGRIDQLAIGQRLGHTFISLIRSKVRRSHELRTEPR
jgi:hypothetical protein